MLHRPTRINFFVLDLRVALALGCALYILIVFTDYLTTYELTSARFIFLSYCW